MANELQNEFARKVQARRGVCKFVNRRTLHLVFVTAAFLLSDTSESLSAQSLTPKSGLAMGTIEPAIPTSSVANSHNGDRIAQLAGQLQAQIEREDLRRSAPLTPSGKFRLALKNFSDPVNIGGTALDAEISNATSSSTSAFGTGGSGFGKRFGMSMADNGLNEFFSTFLVASIAHQDPHYHRDPDANTGKRILYALSRVAVSRSDSGMPMFNYAEFVGTTASALVEVPYHFERDESAGAISSRIVVSIGSDAAWNLMNEFLPDVAKHLNPRFFFLRRLAEKAAKQN